MNGSPVMFSLVEPLLPWAFLSCCPRPAFSSAYPILCPRRLWLQDSSLFFDGHGFVYQAASLIKTKIPFRIFGLCGFDAVVLLVLSCYMLISVGSDSGSGRTSTLLQVP